MYSKIFKAEGKDYQFQVRSEIEHHGPVKQYLVVEVLDDDDTWSEGTHKGDLKLLWRDKGMRPINAQPGEIWEGQRVIINESFPEGKDYLIEWRGESFHASEIKYLGII